MGKGLFAVRDIPRGTRIVEEMPIISLPRPTSPYGSYNDTIRRFTGHAIHDTPAGEQITTCYLKSGNLTTNQRAALLQAYGFSCGCLACTLPALEVLRERALMVRKRVAAYLSHSGVARTLGIDAAEALGYAREHVMLLQQQPKARYRARAALALKTGDLEAARDYAVRELEVQRHLIGTPAEHLRPDRSGAEFWLAFLEEKLRVAGLGS
ncbi:TPR domain protein [Cordyceps fumosorosea ARSEF 2679]|uniref:TPR domain protein n=1 Tax=Cordyceps fumosorosea (strain ARSEF 2679) TaxID=1081104 RepID=A0A167R2P0_CORFA|nr:TPR domain protein [Cordyceps fumosorosea ARSEF 2679]OAA58219.1 TPR domain protein [Cordyceps fumosorosea ARSEF 2679]